MKKNAAEKRARSVELMNREDRSQAREKLVRSCYPSAVFTPRLDLWANRALVIGHFGRVASHAHAASARLIGFDSTFGIRAAGSSWRSADILCPDSAEPPQTKMCRTVIPRRPTLQR